jgi:hypothetical protein
MCRVVAKGVLYDPKPLRESVGLSRSEAQSAAIMKNSC